MVSINTSMEIDLTGLDPKVTNDILGVLNVARGMGAEVVRTGDLITVSTHNIQIIQYLCTKEVDLDLPVKFAVLSPTFEMTSLLQYEGSSEYRPGQRETIAKMVCNPRCFVLNSPRTGKTFAAISATDALMQLGEIEAVLFVSTVSSVVETYPSEFKKLFGSLDKVSFIHGGDVAARRAALAATTPYYVTNYDALKTETERFNKLLRSRRFAVVFDECTILGGLKVPSNISTVNKYTKNSAVATVALQLTKHLKYVYGLTGTPDTPLKIYGFVGVITPDRVRPQLNSFMSVCYNNTPDRPSKWELRDKDIWMPYVSRLLRPSIRIERTEEFVLNKPRFIRVPLEPAHQEVYNQLLKSCITGELDTPDITSAGELVFALPTKPTERVVAKRAATKYFKLLQLANGSIRDDEEKEIKYDVSARFNEIKKLLDATDRKLVVFASFVDVLYNLQAWLEENIAFSSVGLINGSVTGKKRKEIFDAFKDPENPMRILVAHPKTCAHSVEFAGVSDTIIFLGAITSGSEIMVQASDRVKSSKQTSDNVQIIHIYSTDAERATISGVYEGETVNKAILNYVKDTRKSLLKKGKTHEHNTI